MFNIVLRQHVSVLIESSSGPSLNTDPYLAMFKMCCGIPNAYILDITVYKIYFIHTYIYNNLLLCLTDTTFYIYICVKHFGMVKIKI